MFHCLICQIPAIAHFYATVYGDEEDARDDANTTITDLEAMNKAPSASGRRFGEVQESHFQCNSDDLLM